jgi:hypothetical protein
MAATDPHGPEAMPYPNQGLKLVLAWAFVGIPLIWGVVETVQNAMKLFQ